MRLFVAIPIPDNIKTTIAEQTSYLRRKAPQLKWVDPALLHVTLIFIGEIPSKKAVVVKKKFENNLPPINSFQLSYRGLGGFPARGIPRVIFTPFIEGVAECNVLNRFYTSLLKEYVPKKEEQEKKDFKTHLTLARKGWQIIPRRGELLEVPACETIAGEIPVCKIVLMLSKLKPYGPEYVEIGAVTLNS